MIHWKTIKEYDDITFKMADGVARIALNRPEVRNAFRPKTVDELRTLNNPKVTYKPPVVSGKGIDGRTALPNVKRNRTSKTFLNKPLWLNV